MRERAEMTYMSGDFPAGVEMFHSLATRMSGGADLAAEGGAAGGAVPLSAKALEVWFLLASYQGNQAGREEDAIAVCRNLIPYKRRDYIARMYDALAVPGGEYVETAKEELRRLRGLAGDGGGGGDAEVPERADLEALLAPYISDPDDPRADTVVQMAELVTWSTALAKKGRLEESVRLQWRIADICRNNKQMSDTDMQLPTGKVKSSEAYERGLLLDLSVPGVAKVAARMIAERDGGGGGGGAAPANTAHSTAVAADGDGGCAVGVDGGAAAAAAPYDDGRGYLELIQDMSKLWGAQEYDKAEAVCRQIVAVQTAGHGAVSKEAIDARKQLGSLLQSAGRLEDGLAEMRAALAVHEQILHGKDPTMAQTIQAVHGPGHSDVGMALVSLGGFLMADPETLAAGQETLARGMAIQQKFQDDQLARTKAF
ncbi:hypothetical protein GPECTOR_31g369 [Gonium pectorale]|uniref:Uncharacterized protein n=1 Tax=Gonium pectorale TaxID=33097 RepID=A0A150GEK4_GONPE|nr:hypothetical protein GPECTOR_31g369 [Gonium pectorale]|eukprot:KXZ48005.1 hypothetical protein GPECTOR_31g369 [Gonium pectorale]